MCVCVCKGGRITLPSEKDKVRDREGICAEVIMGALLHVVECIVPFPHARPQCLAEH